MGTIHGEPKPSTGPRAAPRRWPQFSLRSLLLSIAALSVLLALGAALGFRWTVVAAWFAVMIALHVAGNVWGTRSAGRRRVPLEDAPQWVRPRGAYPAALSEAYPPTRLRQSRWPGWPMVGVSFAGAVSGAAVGAWALWNTGVGLSAWVGYALGVVSSAAVGGFLAYLASSFLATSLGALREAAAPAGKQADTERRTAS